MLKKNSKNQESTNGRRRWITRAIVAAPLAAYALSGLQNIKEVHAAPTLELGVTNTQTTDADTVVNLFTGRSIQIIGNYSGGNVGMVVAQNAAQDSAALQGWSAATTGIGVVGWGSQAAYFNSYVGIGPAAADVVPPSAPLHMVFNVPTMVIAQADGASPCVFQLDSYGTGSITSGGGFLGRMARGSKSSPSNVAVNDRLGYNIFGGYAGGAFRHTGGFEAVVESGTISSTSLPTGIRFLTTPSGSVNRAERMRIDKDGNVVPPSDGAGSIGTASKRWGLIRGVTVQSGDLAFENDFRVTEDEKVGLAFLNDAGEKIAVLDREGNLRVRGKVMEDPKL